MLAGIARREWTPRRAPTAPSTRGSRCGPTSKYHRSADELRDQILAKAEAEAEQLRRKRKAAGQRVVGWRNVIAASYRDVAASQRAYFQTRPRVTATDDTKRDELVDRISRFETQYRAAVREFEMNREVVFPYGTLQMVQRHAVCCETGPP